MLLLLLLLGVKSKTSKLCGLLSVSNREQKQPGACEP